MAQVLLDQIVHKYDRFASRLAEWLEHSLPEGLTVFSFPVRHRRRLRNTNGLERVSQEIWRRTRGVRIFPNEASCLRSASALLMEIIEEQETGRRYLCFEDIEKTVTK